MTGRRAYEMFTRAFGPMSAHQREKYTQFPKALVAYDDLIWQEKDAWKMVARQIQRHADRSAAARRSA